MQDWNQVGDGTDGHCMQQHSILASQPCMRLSHASDLKLIEVTSHV